MLQFPTMAEQALAEWRATTRTVSLTKVCERRGAEREALQQPDWTYQILWTFDDDTALKVRGRGRGHSVEVLLP